MNMTKTTIQFENVQKQGVIETDVQYNSSNQVIASKKTFESITSSLNADYARIAIENSFIYHSTPKKILSWYCGFSNQLGVSIDNYRYFYLYELRTDQYDSAQSTTQSDIDSTKYHDLNINDKSRIFTSLNLVFGCDLRFSKNEDKRLSRFHLFSEFKPGFAMFYSQNIGRVKTHYNGFWSLVGFRYTFD